jgi:hypothetical protein
LPSSHAPATPGVQRPGTVHVCTPRHVPAAVHVSGRRAVVAVVARTADCQPLIRRTERTRAAAQLAPIALVRRVAAHDRRVAVPVGAALLADRVARVGYVANADRRAAHKGRVAHAFDTPSHSSVASQMSVAYPRETQRFLQT